MNCICYSLQDLSFLKLPFKKDANILFTDNLCFPVDDQPCILGTGNIVGMKKIGKNEKIPELHPYLGQSLNEQEFKEWLKTIIELYPMIKTVWLMGSRNEGNFRDDSDWDVIIELTESCYINNLPNPSKNIEKKIANNQLLNEKGKYHVDIFYLRPDGFIARYFRQSINKSLFKCQGLREKDPVFPCRVPSCCNWESFYDSSQKARVIFERKGVNSNEVLG